MFLFLNHFLHIFSIISLCDQFLMCANFISLVKLMISMSIHNHLTVCWGILKEIEHRTFYILTHLTKSLLFLSIFSIFGLQKLPSVHHLHFYSFLHPYFFFYHLLNFHIFVSLVSIPLICSNTYSGIFWFNFLVLVFVYCSYLGFC